MRLALEIPEGWSRTPSAQEAYQAAPGVVLTLGALRPLPADLRAWGDAIVLSGLDVSQYRVRNVDDVQTSRGWPVSIFSSDIVSIMADSMTRRALSRRLHALYVFDQHCAWASAAGADLERFDSLTPELRKVLLTGRPDWTGDRVASLVEVFAGLAIAQPSAPKESGAKEPDQIK